MNPRVALALVIVLVALLALSLGVGLRRGVPAAFGVPGWAQPVGAWLVRGQALPPDEIRPLSSLASADAGCRDDVVSERPMVLVAGGSCGLFVSSSSKSMRSVALRLVSGGPAEVRVDWVDRGDRLTAPAAIVLRDDGDARVQFYEEGGSLTLGCVFACSVAVVTPAPPAAP